MSAPLRFLGLAIIAYVGLRTASNALALQPLPTPAFPPPASLAPDMAFSQPPAAPYPQASGWPQAAYPPPNAQPMMMPYPMMAAGYPPQRPMIVTVPAAQAMPYPAYPYPMPAPPAPEAVYSAPEGDGAVPPLDQWPTIGTTGSVALAQMQQTPSWGRGGGGDGPIAAARQSRFSLDAWALIRPPREGLVRLDQPGALNPGLVPAGSLGGSQAGMRLSWRPMTGLGIHLRASTAMLPQSRNRQTMMGGEGSFGVSYQPLRSIPVRLMAERRQRMGPAVGGGRNAFALLAEGGVSDQPLPYGIRLDGYGQAGMVGMRSRDLFADGALVASYPFLPRLSIGGGMWGGTQPGLYRFDAGPRLSYQLRPGIRAHLDYRFRVVGNAEPLSGPALTIAGGF